MIRSLSLALVALALFVSCALANGQQPPTAPTPVRADDSDAIPDAEWKEYLAVWSTGSTKPFLVKNAPKRIAVWRKAAEAGSDRGMMLLADCYEFGVGV